MHWSHRLFSGRLRPRPAVLLLFLGVLLWGATPAAAVPVSQIVRPDPDLGILTLGSNLYAEWAGYDPNTGGPVAGFYYKLLRLDTLNPPVSVFIAQPSLLDTQGGPWIFQSAGTTAVNLPVATPGSYLFGVRAVDSTGVEETALNYGRNALLFRSLVNGGLPTLVLIESAVGTLVYDVPGQLYDRDIPQDVALRFEVGCGASSYGGHCADHRWGLDLADPDSAAGWSPYSVSPQIPPISFSAPGDHTLFVEVRDDLGSTQRGEVILHVKPMAFDRKVLLVDDAVNATYPNDAQSDAFWDALIHDSGRFGAGDVERYDAFGAGDYVYLEPPELSLEQLGHYRLIILDTNGAGHNGVSELFEETARHAWLAGYLRAGGRLWLTGTLTVAATTATPNNQSADFTYPKEFPGPFASRFLKLASPNVNNDKAASQRNSLVAVNPFPGKPEVYPRMEMDPAKINPFQGAILRADAVFDPIDLSAGGAEGGVLDSLYVYRTYGAEISGQSSAYTNKLTGLRWHDDGPDPRHGRVQWFGFPMYYWKKAQAQQVFDRTIDWFNLDAPVPVTLAAFTATWTGTGAEIRWRISDAAGLAGFDVYREAAGEERVRVNGALLTGGPEFTFTDPEAPAAGAGYWLSERDRSGGRTWHGPVALAPREPVRFTLALRAAPNPFTAAATVRYTLPAAAPVTLDVFDVQGRRVARLVDGDQEAGDHTTSWNGRTETGARASVGLYLIRLQAGGEQRVVRAVLTR